MGYGCFDSLYFKTNDGLSFGCNARTGTAYTTDNRVVTYGTNPYAITFSGNELALIFLEARSNCMLGRIEVYYKSDPCTSNDVSAITLEMTNVNGKK